jgi:hypothetical protein
MNKTLRDKYIIAAWNKLTSHEQDVLPTSILFCSAMGKLLDKYVEVYNNPPLKSINTGEQNGDAETKDT